MATAGEGFPFASVALASGSIIHSDDRRLFLVNRGSLRRAHWLHFKRGSRPCDGTLSCVPISRSWSTRLPSTAVRPGAVPPRLSPLPTALERAVAVEEGEGKLTPV